MLYLTTCTPVKSSYRSTPVHKSIPYCCSSVNRLTGIRGDPFGPEVETAKGKIASIVRKTRRVTLYENWYVRKVSEDKPFYHLEAFNISTNHEDCCSFDSHRLGVSGGSVVSY